MKTIIIGLGVQGKKRLLHAGTDVVATVDPNSQEASFELLEKVPHELYECALVATPDKAKSDIVKYLIEKRKHVMVEKPFVFNPHNSFYVLEQEARTKGVFVYTAYNHRFEPNFKKMRDFLLLNSIGKIYSCRIFYGNGTARLVKESPWRDRALGVLQDLGSHLLDTVDFWFKRGTLTHGKVHLLNNENESPDHVIASFRMNKILFNLEISLCSWKNTFECDVIGSGGSLHIRGLCKWGSSDFIHRIRKFPSGVPLEETFIEPIGDPTWQLEYKFFTDQINSGAVTSLAKDNWISSSLSYLYSLG